jgi:hypothetical protein
MTPVAIPFSKGYLNRAAIGAGALIVGVLILLVLPDVLGPPWETVIDVLLLIGSAVVVAQTVTMWRRHQGGEPALSLDGESLTLRMSIRPRVVPIQRIAAVTAARSGVLVETDDGKKYVIPIKPLAGDLSPDDLASRLEEAIYR